MYLVFAYREQLPAALLLCLAGFAPPVLGQHGDSAFVACADINDRQQRIACLEDALEAATAPSPLKDTMATTTEPLRPAEQQRVESYGREAAQVVASETGAEALHDTVSSLVLVRPNQWRITLGSGQTWQQVHPKRYNLREGDAVRIHGTTWGDNFRLESGRLSGFIQVLRVE